MNTSMSEALLEGWQLSTTRVVVGFGSLVGDCLNAGLRDIILDYDTMTIPRTSTT